MGRILLVLGTVLFIQTRVFAIVTLQLGPIDIEGNQVIAPVILGGDAGSDVSALDFKLNFDPDALKPVSVRPGIEATNADKRVLANISAPGSYTVVMIGMNQTACRPGEIAEVVLERITGAENRSWALGISELAVSSPDGAPIEGKAIQPEEHNARPNTPDIPEGPEHREPTANRPQATQEAGADTSTGPVRATPVRGKVAPETRVDPADDVERQHLNLAIEEAARARKALAFLDAEVETATPDQPDARENNEVVSNETTAPEQTGPVAVEAKKQLNDRSAESTTMKTSVPSKQTEADRESSGSIGQYAVIGAVFGAFIGIAVALRRRKRS